MGLGLTRVNWVTGARVVVVTGLDIGLTRPMVNGYNWDYVGLTRVMVVLIGVHILV